MEFIVKDYSEISKDTIRMTSEEWDCVRGLDNDGVMRFFLEGITWPDGFPNCLKGLPIKEQLERYAVQESSEYSRSSYGESDKSELSSGCLIPLKDYKGLRGVIVNDNMVIGAIVSDFRERMQYLYPNRPVCLYLDVDTDGTGASSSSVFAYMHCLSV